MSFYRFNDTVTLYTCYDENAYEHHVIDATKVQIIDSDSIEDTKVTVYIPIFGRRTLKYVLPSKRETISKKTFTVKTGQKLVIGKCYDDFPPDRAIDVRRVDTHLSGSHHVQHIKITAYNIPTKNNNEEEESDDEILDEPGDDIFEENPD